MAVFARSLAEFVGTALLVAIVIGSGIMAESLTSDVGVSLLLNQLATVLGLGVLIAVLMPISGAHINPVVTLAFLLRRGVSVGEAVAYVIAQLIGADLSVTRQTSHISDCGFPHKNLRGKLINCETLLDEVERGINMGSRLRSHGYVSDVITLSSNRRCRPNGDVRIIRIGGNSGDQGMTQIARTDDSHSDSLPGFPHVSLPSSVLSTVGVS